MSVCYVFLFVCAFLVLQFTLDIPPSAVMNDEFLCIIAIDAVNEDQFKPYSVLRDTCKVCVCVSHCH